MKKMVTGPAIRKISGMAIVAVILSVAAWTYGNGDRAPVAETPAVSALASVHEIADGGTFDLVAEPYKHRISGVENAMMAYNGSIPGPTMRVKQGSVITVRFANRLAEPTTVHWHGVRVKNAFDGVPDMTQSPVQPGETFDYELRFPDPGAFWYHPHIREDKQQDLGLYGSIIVTPADPAYWPEAAKEESLMLDDILASRGFIAPYFDDMIDHALMGRYGNVMLVNGTEQPAFTAVAGESVRYYLTNVANARPFNVEIPGALMTVVGSDAGRAEVSQETGAVLLAPSERAVVHAVFPRAGMYEIVHRTPARTYRLATVNVSAPGSQKVADQADGMSVSPDLARADFSGIRPHLDRAIDSEWKLDVETTHMMNHADAPGDIEWEDDMPMMNAHMTDKTTRWKIIDVATGKENMEIGTMWKTGEYRKIRIVNDGNSDHPMQHPIHLHGQRFVVAAVNGVPNADLEWKDTVLVRKGSVTDIVVEVTNPGAWMAHCHIAEHLHAGMMTEVMVEGVDLAGSQKKE